MHTCIRTFPVYTCMHTTQASYYQPVPYRMTWPGHTHAHYTLDRAAPMQKQLLLVLLPACANPDKRWPGHMQAHSEQRTEQHKSK
jgi:hypothetical protein